MKNLCQSLATIFISLEPVRLFISLEPVRLFLLFYFAKDQSADFLPISAIH